MTLTILPPAGRPVDVTVPAEQLHAWLAEHDAVILRATPRDPAPQATP